MIFSFLVIHNHDRMSSITRVLHTKTLDCFTSCLADRFIRSPKVVKEAIMTDINDLVQEFWRTSSYLDVGASSFFVMHRLFEILQSILEVRFDTISVFATVVDIADKTYRCRIITLLSGSIPTCGTLTESEPNLRYCLMGIDRCLTSHFRIPKIWVTYSGSYLVS